MTHPILSVRRSIMTGLAVVAVLVAGLGTWTISTNIAGAIVASGQVQVDQRRQIVQHPNGGTVARINVRDGDHVTTG